MSAEGNTSLFVSTSQHDWEETKAQSHLPGGWNDDTNYIKMHENISSSIPKT